jgi:hypothetical protein
MSGGNESRLDEVFAAYRAAIPDPEPSADFMPELWRRIEMRRRPAYSLRRFARGFVTAAFALCFGMAVLSWSPSNSSNASSTTYVDVLNSLDDEQQQEVELIAGVGL